jgi:hypothetical protein
MMHEEDTMPVFMDITRLFLLPLHRMPATRRSYLMALKTMDSKPILAFNANLPGNLTS